jgi:hypothetical protein
VIDEHLRTPAEEIAQRRIAVFGREPVVLVNLHPGQLTPASRKFVAAVRQFLFSFKELEARCEPFVSRADCVRCHQFVWPPSCPAADNFNGGADRNSECVEGRRLPACVRHAPVLKDSSTGARRGPRVAAVVRTDSVQLSWHPPFVAIGYRDVRRGHLTKGGNHRCSLDHTLILHIVSNTRTCG